jgi:hypothetical protein
MRTAAWIAALQSPPQWLKDWSFEESYMRKVSLIAGMASLATVAAVLWSMPAAAEEMGSASHQAFDKWPGSDRMDRDRDDVRATTFSPVRVPEPGTFALWALGLSGLGLVALSRKRARN